MSIKNYNVHPAIYFIVAALLLSYFFPREGKFKYQFYEGKPWRYELLTAPSNFPIYKSDDQVKAEQDSVLKKFQPYYRVNPLIETSQIDKLREDYQSHLSTKVTSAYMQYIEKMLQKLYANGIVSSSDFEKLRAENYAQINLIQNTISSKHFVSDLFTVKTAYEFIINNCPASLNKSLLQSCDINNYLAENVSYDQDMSDKVRNELLQSVPISSGIVQAGERIVDRGEIIDSHTYNVLRSLKTVYESKSGGTQRHNLMLAGQIILVFGLLFCYWLYLWSFRPKILHNRRNTFFLLCCIFWGVLITEICATNLFNIYIIPYAIIPIVVRTFFDSRTALFTHLITVLICSVMAPFPHEFLILQIIAGMVVTFSLKELSQRSQLMHCALFVFLSYTLSYVSLVLYQDADFNKIHWVMILYFGINFILLMFTYVLVYMLEKTFGYLSTITLVELSNINSGILKKLSETCPGTFQHSLQVSIIASEAAVKIGANAQLVRTGAMYHDIGKMSNPIYFTENQNNGVNPHSTLSYVESAQRVISHVTEGVKIAEKAGLPKEIIDFIRTHHGRGKAKYFYNSYKNQYPDKPMDESLFTYPGPNPFSKETAILMMADSVEAASRSLKEHTEEGIKQLVYKIINGQIADGLLRNTPLTFRDVESVKQVFIEKLKIMYHTRISYPDLKKKN